ncbi:MAG: SusC/RagA family TonB-linked outer membrane protein, partial [Bacteroidota bacterium]
GEIDYYVKNTDDLLLNVNVPSTTGFIAQLRNVGELENSGFEFVLNSENLVGDFRWSTSLNFAANTNEITDLQSQVIEGGFINRAVEGQAIGVFFAPEYAGVDPENGDALYFLNTELPDGGRDRNTTNNVNDAERVVIGNPNPDFIYGMNNSFSWKGIDLAIFIQGVQGNDIYNGGGVFQLDGFGWFDNQDRSVLNRWQQPGDQTDIPQLRFLGGSAESSRFLSDGSYLRLKTVSLGYTLPSSITSKVGIDNLRIYVTGQNLAILTDYEGWDPEVNADYIAGNIGLGNDFYSGPQARTIVVGANVGF